MFGFPRHRKVLRMTHISRLATSGNVELQDALDAPISRANPDRDTDQNNQRSFDRRCAAIIPQMRTNGYSWGGFADFSPAAVDWLKSNQNVVRANKGYFDRQRPSKQQANEAWAKLTR